MQTRFQQTTVYPLERWMNLRIYRRIEEVESGKAKLTVRELIEANDD
jgi:transposase